VAALTEVDNDGMAMMVNNARAAMSFFMTISSSMRSVSKPDWLLPMRLPSSKIYSRSWFENSVPSITAE
jgi:hypothetical protein